MAATQSAKRMASYRINKSTRNQMAWLEKRLGDVSATDVIGIAVSDLYHRKKKELETRLVQKEDICMISVGGIPIASVDTTTFSKLPLAQQKQIASGSENAVVDLVLSLHRIPGSKITFYPEGAKIVFGDRQH